MSEAMGSEDGSVQANCLKIAENCILADNSKSTPQSMLAHFSGTYDPGFLLQQGFKLSALSSFQDDCLLGSSLAISEVSSNSIYANVSPVRSPTASAKPLVDDELSHMQSVATLLDHFLRLENVAVDHESKASVGESQMALTAPPPPRERVRSMRRLSEQQLREIDHRRSRHGSAYKAEAGETYTAAKVLADMSTAHSETDA